MGVSGAGKTTIGAALARRLGWQFQEGDALHPPENVARMHAGIPLGDADRAPWLRAVAARIDKWRERGEAGVITCSALKRKYRDIIVGDRPDVRLVYLTAPPALIAERLAGRRGHFMPASLLESQLATLEPPGPDENALTVAVDAPVETVVERIAASLTSREERNRSIASLKSAAQWQRHDRGLYSDSRREPARSQEGTRMTNPLRTLQEYGQSVWLDFVSRELLKSGGLNRLVAEDGLRGVTSNPSIFEKAIGHGDDYDELIAAAERSGDLDPGALFEELAIRDIQDGADALNSVYEQTQRRDGYISIEVSPYLAMHTHETIEEARRLWGNINRRNLMVKVPGTRPGLPAIRTLIGEGINVNVTLLFSQKVYEEVAEAYIAGLEDFVAKGGDPHKVASVASFFVSRIDTLVDEALDKRIAATSDAAGKQKLSALKGRIAIANAKLAYQAYQRIFGNERWQRLAQKGAQTQRLLWASTGTKNPSYSDVLYVEELIGPDTVNTMPPATMDAFRDHGTPRASLEEDVADAQAVMDALSQAGISIDEITARLVEDGVKLFADAADQLYAAVQKKRRTVLGSKLDAMSYKLPKELDDGVKAALEEWRAQGKVRRLWAGDASLWTEADEANWLGWLTIVDQQLKAADHLDAFAADVKRADFSDALLLGMGGSSLCAEVLAESFGTRPGFPRLRIVEFDRPGADPPHRGFGRSAAHAVHCVEQIGQHARTEHLQAVFLRPGAGGVGRGGRFTAFRRDHRSRLVARKDRAA